MSDTRLFIARISPATRARDLDDLFSRYGRVRDVMHKGSYAFVVRSEPSHGVCCPFVPALVELARFDSTPNVSRSFYLLSQNAP